MKPYYHDENAGITIYNGRAEDVLPKLGPVDLVLTDPPYAEQTHAGARTAQRKQVTYWEKVPNSLVDFASFTIEQQRACFDLIGHVAKAWVVSFMDWRHIAAFETEPPTGLRFIRFGVWVKPNGAPQFTGDRPATGWEGIAILHRIGGKMRWNGGGHHAVWTCNKAHQDSYPGDHPTVKPLPLVSTLVKLFSSPGELVLDPFGGTGTTARACKDLGRRCILIEREEKYAEIAARRLSQEVLQLEAAP